MKQRISRRRFLGSSAALGAGLSILPTGLARGYTANEKVNVALVGVCGRGEWFVNTMPALCNLAAFCDVNEWRTKETYQRFPNTPKFVDFRKMLDVGGKQIDGVIVATPDNTHAVIAMAAIKHGKAVYCEKPLAHDVYEARALRDAAAEHKVVTQKGNQGTSSEALRRCVELVQAGVLGEIQEVDVWNSDGGEGQRELPKERPPCPDYLHWDLWLGPAADRPYHPFWLNWHGWRELATGALGNWGSHTMNLPFMALRIDSLWQAGQSATAAGAPRKLLRIESRMSEITRLGFPRWQIIRYHVPARFDLPAIVVNWYGGAGPGVKERTKEILDRGKWKNAEEHNVHNFAACHLRGPKGTILTTGHNMSYRLMPEEQFAKFEGPPKSLPRTPGHEYEWLEAIKGKTQTMSNFNYSGPLAEFLLLGNVATLFEGPLEYDPLAGKIVNNPQADLALRRQYRPGWSL
jgi:hypothetical protein